MRRLWLRSRLRVERRRARPGFWGVVFVVVLLASVLLGVRVGAAELGTGEIVRALWDAADPMHRVMWDVRLPRVACGLAVGAALSVAGALLQTVVRNPLADPGVVGVSAGAGLAALVTILLFPASVALLPLFAFAGGLGAIALLLALAWSRGSSAGPLRIVLSGVALQATLAAIIAMLTFAFADRAPAFVSFLVGSLNGLGWSDAALVAAPTVVGLGLSLGSVRVLNLLLLDDATAGGLGVSVRRARFAASSLSALLSAGAVSVAGLVGFVGLVVPNGVRVLVGPDHRVLIPLAALGGAALVLLADGVARTVLAPLELPVGALLALIGGPYFLVLLWRKLP